MPGPYDSYSKNINRDTRYDLFSSHNKKMAKIANMCHILTQEDYCMATMNVSLPDLMREWVDQQIQSGHYSNASDYVRDLIRRDQEYLDKREILVQALLAGEESGKSTRTIEDIWDSLKARHRADV